ncbi:MAG: hypothetical protein M0Z68_09430 [Gammaproteobacteria bacterium]|nr:hypothetical protein [Gammaproteobacteria bacterium]
MNNNQANGHQCYNCAAFNPSWNHLANVYGPTGQCRRHAPTGSGDYPRTTQDGWCCEFVLSATAATATAAAAATVPTEAAISSGSAQAKNPVQSGDMIMTTITNDELRSLIARAIISIRDTINAIGGCDHDVNICCCDEKLLVEELQSALSKLAAAASEPTK